MKAQFPSVVCLALCFAGCANRSSGEGDAARLHDEQAKNLQLAQRLNDSDTSKAAAEQKAAELAEKLAAAQKQLTDEADSVIQLRRQLAESAGENTAIQKQLQQALADNEALRKKPATGGTLQTIEDAPRAGAIPDEIRTAFRNALAWRVDQIRSLQIEIRDTPTKADQRKFQLQLDKLRVSPLSPAPLLPSDLMLGQLGPLVIDDHLRVDEVVDDKTVIVTPVKLDSRLTAQAGQQPTPSGLTAATDSVAEDANPIAIHGLSTKGVVTGAKITNLPGLFWVQKTERYGTRTIFVLAPVDPNKVREYFDLLQKEMHATAAPKRRATPEAAK